jgi:hypothetical protein
MSEKAQEPFVHAVAVAADIEISELGTTAGETENECANESDLNSLHGASSWHGFNLGRV